MLRGPVLKFQVPGSISVADGAPWATIVTSVSFTMPALPPGELAAMYVQVNAGTSRTAGPGVVRGGVNVIIDDGTPGAFPLTLDEIAVGGVDSDTIFPATFADMIWFGNTGIGPTPLPPPNDFHVLAVPPGAHTATLKARCYATGTVTNGEVNIEWSRLVILGV